MSSTAPSDRPEAVVTLGVFDGVHRGHRALLETVVRRAEGLGRPSVAVTFDPHPISILAPSAPPHLLTARPLKMRYLAELGLDYVWFLPFSRALAAMSPEDFVRKLLLRVLRPREVWIGHDFRFGHDRRGDAALLQAEGIACGFEVFQFEAVRDRDRILSSSLVRASLSRGAIEEATEILGHSVVLEGPVGYGRGQGAKVLVATANLVLPPEQFLPARGVYAAWAEVDGELHPAVLNVGIRPTLTAGAETVVEAHLIDWRGDLRGRILSLHLVTRLRSEQTFAGLEELRAQVGRDIAAARHLLAARGEPRPWPAAGSRDGATETKD
jgi:riboflavin kinase/FMN adenylyltransferase